MYIIDTEGILETRDVNVAEHVGDRAFERVACTYSKMHHRCRRSCCYYLPMLLMLLPWKFMQQLLLGEDSSGSNDGRVCFEHKAQLSPKRSKIP